MDDTERATILLHEAYHVFGDDEKFALRRVWLVKERLGWTSLRYGHTRVWKNTREWTHGAVPESSSRAATTAIGSDCAGSST